MNKTAALLTIGFLAGVALSLAIVRITSHPTPDSVMRDFHRARERAEDMLMDPLILHALTVRDRVIADVSDPRMDKRRYAIGFLGNERFSEALPVLRQILENEQEKDYFRGDALSSIWQIDRREGIERASTYVGRSDFLGRVAQTIAEGTHAPYKRPHWKALLGVHE